jgi:hypothetical protein
VRPTPHYVWYLYLIANTMRKREVYGIAIIDICLLSDSSRRIRSQLTVECYQKVITLIPHSDLDRTFR